MVSMISCSSFDMRLQQAVKNKKVFHNQIVGQGFTHTSFSNVPLLDSPVYVQAVDRQKLLVGKPRIEQADHVLNNGGVLSIYIGGDGTPWINGRLVAQDPTPRNPLAAKLFLQDSAPAVFLARPCYFRGFVDMSSAESRCGDSVLWTSGRYSSQVLDSMQRAIENILQAQKVDQVVLIGYSGGGVLAALLAERMPAIAGLVTISANLDIDSWTEHHGYLPLNHSVNPMGIQALRAGLWHIHLVGGQDTVVPVRISTRFAEKFNGEVWRYKKFNHVCCWEREWPSILKRLEAVFTGLEKNYAL